MPVIYRPSADHLYTETTLIARHINNFQIGIHLDNSM